MGQKADSVNTGDKALERIIAELTAALAMTADPRLAKLQAMAVSMRSAKQVAHMERAQGIAERGRKVWQR